jgi:hypothetical protein
MRTYTTYSNTTGSVAASATLQTYNQIGLFTSGATVDSSLAGLWVAEVFGPFTYKILYQVNPSGSWTSSLYWFGVPGCGPAAPNVICSPGSLPYHVTDWKFSFAWETQPAAPTSSPTPAPTLPPQGTTASLPSGTTGTITTGMAYMTNKIIGALTCSPHPNRL